MVLKRIGLAVLLILTFSQIGMSISNIVKAADKGSDTPLDPNCVTDCATYSSQVTSGIVACLIFAVIWIWIFRRRRKNRSSTETVVSLSLIHI